MKLRKSADLTPVIHNPAKPATLGEHDDPEALRDVFDTGMLRDAFDRVTSDGWGGPDTVNVKPRNQENPQ